MNKILETRVFVKKIFELSKASTRCFNENPEKAAKLYLKALKISDDFSYSQIKSGLTYFDAHAHTGRAFLQLNKKIVDIDKKVLSRNSNLKILHRMLTDGQVALYSSDNDLLTLAERIAYKNPNRRERVKELEIRKEEIYLLYCSIYFGIRGKIGESLPIYDNKDFLEFRFFDDSFSLKDVSGLVSFIGKHNVHKSIERYVCYWYNTRVVRDDDLTFTPTINRSSVKERKNRFKKDILLVSERISDDVKDTIKINFNDWFNEKTDGEDDGDTYTFHGNEPKIYFKTLRSFREELCAIHEFGHAVFHHYSNKNRKFGEHYSSLMLEELIPLIFEWMLIFEKIDTIKKNGEEAQDFLLDFIIPATYFFTIEQALATDFSINLLLKIPEISATSHVEDLYLKSIKKFYRKVRISKETRSDWMNSYPLTSPFYGLSYLLAYPLAFSIAADIHNKGAFGKGIIDYILNHRGIVTTEDVLLKMELKTVKDNYESMFAWIKKTLSINE